MRKKVCDRNFNNNLLKYYYLLKIKKTDAYHNASMGTDINGGAYFETPPKLMHGLSGIFISPLCRIGKNCTLHQQVTLASDLKGHGAVVGDNCVIGAGAKLMGKSKIGNNVIVGANAVVTKEFPDNVVIGGNPAKIIGEYNPKIHRWNETKSIEV